MRGIERADSESRAALHDTAVSKNGCRRDVARAVTSEKCDEPCNFFRLGHSSERNRAIEFFQ